MRKLFEQLRIEVNEFIEQRDDLLLLVACGPNDTPLFLKTLRDIEQAAATDLFLLFGDKFVEAVPFVSVTVERLREELRMASDWLQENNREPFPPLPEIIQDESQSPIERLREAIVFTRSLVPREGGHRLVWAMCPEEIENQVEYLKIIGSFVPWNGVRPWMQGVRLIFRNVPDSKTYAPQLDDAPRVRFTNVDFSTDAVADSLAKEAEDEELPEDQRMQSLMSLALLDFGHNRPQDAIAKYEILLGFYQHKKNLMMQAFVMNGIGDVFFHRVGDLEKAKFWYECAVPPAGDAKAPIILAASVKNLGDVAYKEKRFADAEQFFDKLDQLKAHLLDPEGKAQALEWRGLSQEKQGAYARAVESWEAAALLCRNIGFPIFLKGNLEHLRRVYKRLQINDKRKEVEAELKLLKEQEGLK